MISAKAKKLDLSVSELMRRGATAYKLDESEEELGAIADAAKAAANRASYAIDDMLSFVNASNKRIAAMEAKAIKKGKFGNGCDRTRIGALTSMIKLEDKVVHQGEVIKAQQSKIENLTERMIRMEAIIELLTHTGEHRRIK